MLNAVTSMGHLPHTKLDNQQTHYDSVRSDTQFGLSFNAREMVNNDITRSVPGY